MKKEKNTNIIFLLDETGSMESIKNETIGGFNGFVKKQKNTKENIRFSLTLFNSSKIEKRYIDQPIKNVKLLNENNYVPSNLTPLWDAIGLTIKAVPNDIKNVLFIILTDGMENYSKDYNASTIKKIIKEKEKKKKWKFLFLGADLNDFSDARKLGIKDSYYFSKYKIEKEYEKLSDSVAHFTKTGKIKFDND